MIRRKAEKFVPASVVFLGISMLLERIGGPSAWSSFLAGMFLGLSITLAAFGFLAAAEVKNYE